MLACIFKRECLKTMGDGQTDTTGAPSEQHIIEKVLHVSIRGTLQKFQQGGVQAASWCPQDGKAGEVFGVNDFFDTAPDIGQTAAVLQNALLHEVEVVGVQNGFPVNIGVSISCIPGGESLSTGHRYAFTTLANSTCTTPECIFSSASSNSEGIEWRSKYPNYNATNLDSYGVLQVQGQSYVFVSQYHPVIDLLRTNAEKLNASIDDQPLIDNQWYKVTKQVMNQCCHVLRNKVLSKVSTRDMNDFSVQLHRIGTNDWVDHSIIEEIHSAIPADVDLINQQNPDLKHRSQYISAALNKPYNWTARIRVKYEINTA